MGNPQLPLTDAVPIVEYVEGTFVPISHLAHGWEFHASLSLTPAEERTMIREPADAVPDTIAQKIGNLRVLAVPYISCLETGDVVTRLKPKGEAHTAAWVESSERISLLLACRELDAHDTGFEFLGSVAELLRPRLADSEVQSFSQLLQEEVRHGVAGEIDEEARSAKRAYMGSMKGRRQNSQFERYRDVALTGTVAEYMHGLWHDVQIQVGPDHLPVAQLRRRMDLMSQFFPPNSGYKVFDEAMDKAE